MRVVLVVAALTLALAAPAAGGTAGSAGADTPGLLPQALAAVLGLVAASLAYRQVARRARRHQPPGGRQDRTGTPPGPDRASSRRR
jgi:hypothetical protein